MTYGNNQYTFSTKTTIGFKNIAINAKTDKEAFAIVSNSIGPDDQIIGFSTERCVSTAALIRDYLNENYTDDIKYTFGMLEGANFILRATPKWWEDMIIKYFDIGVGDNACWIDEPVTYEILDDAITDFIIDKCVHFFHAEDRIFCMIDFTRLNDGSWFEFPDGELKGSTVIDGWCWESECDTDEDFLDFFGDKIRATINAFLARLRG